LWLSGGSGSSFSIYSKAHSDPEHCTALQHCTVVKSWPNLQSLQC
jgi:hypothetical protein